MSMNTTTSLLEQATLTPELLASIERLREMAETYGTKATLALVEGALHETEASAA